MLILGCQRVSGYYTLTYFIPVMMPVLGSLVGEWPIMPAFHACLCCLFLVPQFVSDYLAIFVPVYDAYSWPPSL